MLSMWQIKNLKLETAIPQAQIDHQVVPSTDLCPTHCIEKPLTGLEMAAEKMVYPAYFLMVDTEDHHILLSFFNNDMMVSDS